MELKAYLLNYGVFFSAFSTAFLVSPTQLYLTVLCVADVETLEITSKPQHAWNAGVGMAFYFVLLLGVLAAKYDLMGWCARRRRRVSGQEGYELIQVAD